MASFWIAFPAARFSGSVFLFVADANGLAPVISYIGKLL